MSDYVLIAYNSYANGQPRAMILNTDEIHKLLHIFTDGRKRFTNFVDDPNQQILEIYLSGTIKMFDIYKISKYE